MRRTIALAALTALAVSLMAVMSAGAAGMTQVRGKQRPAVASDRCGGVGDPFWYMEGAADAGSAQLIGCWTTTDAVIDGYTPSGVIRVRGTEHFVGCVDLAGDGSCDAGDPDGGLFFSFQATLKYDPTSSEQEHGRCYHPITGGEGDLAGASGALRFKDDPATGCSYYSGHLTLED